MQEVLKREEWWRARKESRGRDFAWRECGGSVSECEKGTRMEFGKRVGSD